MSEPVSVKKVQIRPGVGLLNLFPAMNYKPWFALGEFVDNSIQSFVEHQTELKKLHGPLYKLRIEITFVQGVNPKIIVEDNAAGIFLADLERAFTPAVRPPDRSGLSQFGIGMKSAATWYANNFAISSSALGEYVTRNVGFDIPKIIEENIEELSVHETPKNADVHGTRIEMHNLHQGIPVGMTLRKIRSYLSSIYREFLRAGEIEITVGSERLSYIQPDLLNAPFWSSDKGPDESAVEQTWTMPIDFVLRNSWEQDSGPDRPIEPPRIRGWMGILREGSTKQSGTALIWKRKVVVGAGSMAQGDEDSYRPNFVFGASTTFPFQRLFGELDVSELQVTTFKDQIDWRGGQEQDLQEELKRALASGDTPLIRMARNYRSTLKTPAIQDTVEKNVKDTVDAASGLLDQVLHNMPQPTEASMAEGAMLGSGETDLVAMRIPMPDDPTTFFTFQVVVQPGENQWMRILYTEKDGCLISVNRAHPFMNSFANLPGADLEPILRIAMALGLAEVAAKNSAIEFPQFIRIKMNEMLRGNLSSRLKDE